MGFLQPVTTLLQASRAVCHEVIVTQSESDCNQVAMWQISQVSESVASKYVHSNPSFVNSAEYKSHNDDATSSRPTLRNYRPCNTLLICSANTSPPKLGADNPYLREIDNVPARKILAVQKKRALATRLRPARERLAVKHLGSYVL